MSYDSENNRDVTDTLQPAETGGVASPLDKIIPLTLFFSFSATSKREEQVSLRALADRIQHETADEKKSLPWLKLARFGDQPTQSGCLRNNKNMIDISGIEGDYDGGRMTTNEAAEALQVHGIAGIIYTTPSHSADKPHWRVLCPTSRSLQPGERSRLVARLNGTLGGVLAKESFILSQGFYYGSVSNNPAHSVQIVEGIAIDLADNLDAGAIEKPVPATLSNVLPALPADLPADEHARLALDSATALFDDARGDRHNRLVAATMAVAPFVKAGLLSDDTVHQKIAEAMIKSGRKPNTNEIESALNWALDKVQPYEPRTAAVDEFHGEDLPRDESAQAEVRETEWKRQLLRHSSTGKAGSKEGAIKANLHNALIAFRFCPAWERVAAYDEFANRIVLLEPPPWAASDPREKDRAYPRDFSDGDLTEATAWLQAAGIEVSSSIAGEALLEASRKQGFHPVRRYLDGLTWDGVARIDRWLIDFLGAEDTPLHRAFSTKFLVSAIARVFNPGCKVDTVLVLEGPQGLKKSQALATLAGKWFTDHIPDLGSKDAAIQLQGVWIVEHAEFDKLGKAEAGRLNTFISSQTDRFRPPFGKSAEDFPRQCVFAATINPRSIGYLNDETGARRFWPVTCAVGWAPGRKVDIELLAATRDQLWAEARARYRNNELWWLDDGLEARQATLAGDRLACDPWASAIESYIADLDFVVIADILSNCLGITTRDQNRGNQDRVGRVLRAAGWLGNSNRRLEGKQLKGFKNPNFKSVVTQSPGANVVSFKQAETGRDTKRDMEEMLG